jgi:hypothetical protein
VSDWDRRADNPQSLALQGAKGEHGSVFVGAVVEVAADHLVGSGSVGHLVHSKGRSRSANPSARQGSAAGDAMAESGTGGTIFSAEPSMKPPFKPGACS